MSHFLFLSRFVYVSVTISWNRKGAQFIQKVTQKQPKQFLLNK